MLQRRMLARADLRSSPRDSPRARLAGGLPACPG
jgi:hypothetical protein